MNSLSLPSKLVLTYFNTPARAESIRIALRFASIPFEDHRINFPDWKELKPTLPPWEHLPVLEADGERIFHSNNILQYVGRFTGLIPSTALEEFRMNEVIYGCEDITVAIVRIGPITDPEKKLEARRALCVPGGGVYTILGKLQNHLGDKAYVAGEKFTIGDAALFATLCNLKSGFYDGFPSTILEPFPRLVAYHHRIASLPDIAKGYEHDTSAWIAGFRP